MEKLTFAVSDSKVTGRTLSGTAHVYGGVTVDGRKHAFTAGQWAQSIAAGKVGSFAFHDETKPLAGQKNGSLRLKDGKALEFEIDLPEGVSYAEDLRALVASGVDLGMSFQILPGKSTTKAGVKTWTESQLISVDPVALPAFEGTSVILNSVADIKLHNIVVGIRARVRAAHGR